MNKSDREMLLEFKQEIAELTKLVKELSFALGLNYKPSKTEPAPYDSNPSKRRRTPYEPIFLKEREYLILEVLLCHILKKIIELNMKMLLLK